MRGRELERRSRVFYVAAWGATLEQPAWALELGIKLQRAFSVSLEEACAVASTGAAQTGYPALVQRWLVSPAAGAEPAVRLRLATWLLVGPDRPWVEQ